MLVVREGKSARFAVNVRRGEGQTGEISLSVADLPAGLSVAPIVLAPGQSSAELAVEARGAVWGMESSFRVVAEAYGQTGEATVKVFPLGPIGAVDTRFGTRGAVSLPTVPDGYQGCSSWRTNDDKLIVLTGASGELKLTRISADGSIDALFAEHGTLTITNMFGSWPRAPSTRALVHVLANGGFFVLAAADDPGSGSPIDGIALMKFRGNGAIDPSFGFGGGVGLYTYSRPLGLGVTPAGDVMVWRRDLSLGGMMTKFSANGQTHVESAPAPFSAASADMIMQDDGKPVVVGGDTGGYLLSRFTNAPALDPNFGRNNVLPTLGPLLSWSQRSDGRFIGTGIRYGYPSENANSAWVMEFDSSWRASPGYENGGVTLTSIPTFAARAVETYEGGNLIPFPFEGALYATHLVAGQVDISLGPNGMTLLTASTTGAELIADSAHTAVLSWPRLGQSCELLRIWR